MTVNRIWEVLVWLHSHTLVYETLMEDFDGDAFMGYEDRNASDVSDTVRQILDKKVIKYRSNTIYRAIKYEREHPEIGVEIEDYLKKKRN